MGSSASNHNARKEYESLPAEDRLKSTFGKEICYSFVFKTVNDNMLYAANIYHLTLTWKQTTILCEKSFSKLQNNPVIKKLVDRNVTEV